MSDIKPVTLLLGPAKALIANGLSAACDVRAFPDVATAQKQFTDMGQAVRAIAISIGNRGTAVDGKLMAALPHLEIVSTFGVGYDHVDAAWAGAHGVTVTNTPDVLTEEVADTALGLLLSTARELSRAERHLRSGQWTQKPFHLTKATLRDRTVGIVGLGRIGKAIARRLDAFGVPVVYFGRKRQGGVSYKYYGDLVTMASEVDTLVVVTPGGAETQHLINETVLKALGPNGILINVARGSVVDEPALIKALKDGTILSAGLDVFAAEPVVPQELIDMEHVVLLPHVASASVHTRQKMDQLVVDNLLCWAAGKPPLTPVVETPWPPQHRR